MRVIAFAGPKGSGKDAAARYLLARNTLRDPSRRPLFFQMNFADTLKQSLELIFGLTQQEMYDPTLKEKVLERWPNKTPRELLQSVANLFRTMYAPDIWVRAWERKLSVSSLRTECFIVTDLRHPEELEKLRELKAVIVYVLNDKVERTRQEGITAGDPLWSDSSEAFAKLMAKEADYTLQNDGVNIDKLYANVEAMAQKLLGNYMAW